MTIPGVSYFTTLTIYAELDEIGRFDGDKAVVREIKQLVLVDVTVCLLGRRHTFSKQTPQLTGFVRY
jgi:hypothetical protein